MPTGCRVVAERRFEEAEHDAVVEGEEHIAGAGRRRHRLVCERAGLRCVAGMRGCERACIQEDAQELRVAAEARQLVAFPRAARGAFQLAGAALELREVEAQGAASELVPELPRAPVLLLQQRPALAQTV